MGNDALKMAQSPCQPETAERYYTLHEAAAYLNVSVTELEHAIAKHALPFVPQFGRKLIAESDVAAYLVRHASPVSPPAP